MMRARSCVALVLLSAAGLVVAGCAHPVTAVFQCRVFELEKTAVDAVIPHDERTAIDGSVYSVSWVPQDKMGSLLRSIPEKPGLLVQKARMISGWPKVADGWTYARHGEWHCTGRGPGFLGVRKSGGMYQIRVDHHVEHFVPESRIQSTIAYEGEVPGAAHLVFLAPFKRKGAGAQYHLIAFNIVGILE